MLNFSVTFFITLLNIAVLFILLRILLFKPVTKFMAERAQRVQDSIVQAEKNKLAAKNLLAECEARLKTADAEAEKIIQDARELAKRDAEHILAESRAKAQRITEAAQTRLETDRQEALVLFKKEAAALVVNAAGRILGRELAGAEQQRYAAESLEYAVSDAGSSRMGYNGDV